MAIRSESAPIVRTPDGYQISAYAPGEVSDRVLTEQIAKLKIAFPRREGVFFNILTERIIANRFSEKRLIDAVNRIIDTFEYKEFNVSDIVSFDRKIKLYTYHEAADTTARMGGKMSDLFEHREINGRHFWVKIADLQMF